MEKFKVGMTTDDAKKILSGNIAAVSPEILQKAANIILSELGKAEEKISVLEKKIKPKKIFECPKNWFDLENLPNEIWREIENYEEFYQVSNCGRIKSFHNKKEKIMIPSMNKDGYLRLNLSKYGSAKNFMVHILVARAFISNPENKPILNHIDNNHSNNHIDNLEWATYSENTKHAYKMGLISDKCSVKSKLTSEQVREIRRIYKPRDKEFSTYGLARKYGVSPSTILRIVHLESYKKVEWNYKVSDNEKYSFRCWLLRLNLNGDEFKTCRHHLLKNLEGNSAWRMSNAA